MLMRILASVLAVIFIACSSDSDTPATSQPQFTTIEQSALTTSTRKFAAIKSQSEWAETWSQLHSDKALPVVDFSQNMVLCMFPAQPFGSCYAVTIDSVVRTSGATTVNFREVPPPAGTACVQILAYPYLIATIAKSDAPVEFQCVPAWTVIEKGDSTQVEPKQVSINSATELEALWGELYPDATVPTVDFSLNTVVCIFLGERPTSCYSVTIDSVLLGTDKTTVRYREVTPGPNAVCAQVITHPSIIATIPKSDVPVEFQAIP